MVYVFLCYRAVACSYRVCNTIFDLLQRRCLITLVGTGVLDGPLQTVRIAENFVKWTVEDAGPYNFCAVCLEHAMPFAVTVWAGGLPLPYGCMSASSLTNQFSKVKEVTN